MDASEKGRDTTLLTNPAGAPLWRKAGPRVPLRPGTTVGQAGERMNRSIAHRERWNGQAMTCSLPAQAMTPSVHPRGSVRVNAWAVIVCYSGAALPISARDMTVSERRYYGRHR